MAISEWRNPIIYSLFLVLLAKLCSCEFFYRRPSIRSSYYGSYLYRPRRYYYGGYGSRWSRPGLDRLSSGLIKRADGYDQNIADNLDNDDDDSFMDKYSDEELKYIIQNILKAKSNQVKRGFDRLTSGFIRKKRSAQEYEKPTQSKERRKRSTNAIQSDTELNTDRVEPTIHNTESEKVTQLESKRADEEFFSIYRDRNNIDLPNSEAVNEESPKIETDTDSHESISDKENKEETQSLKETSEIDSETNEAVAEKSHESKISETDNKRSFDRLRSGFVKKQADKRRGFDRLTSGFVKKNNDKRYFDRLTSGFVKKDSDKRRFDRLTSGFVKKDDQKRRGIDRLTSGFVKKDNDKNIDDVVIADEKRGFDRLTSGFVKKDAEKRYIGRLASGFVKKDENKRRFDRLTSGFVKKDYDKRRFDRLTSGFVKKDDEKRRFDRLTSGFVKKDIDEGNIGPQMQDLVEMKNDKRRFDRLTSGFVKKKDDKRRFDRLNAGFVKRDDNKRYVGRLNSGFVKKDTEKRRFDRLTSGFVKKNDIQNQSDNLNAESFNKYDTSVEDDIDEMGKYYDALKDDAIITNNDLNSHLYKYSNSAKGQLNDESDENGLETEKRRMDRVAYGFIKRNDETADYVPIIGTAQSDLQKRYFDRLTSGFVKRDDFRDSSLAKRRFDRLYSGFVKRPYSENSDMDRIDYEPVKQVEYATSNLYPADSDVSNILEDYENGEINMPETPIKRKRRSIYGYENGAFPFTGNGFSNGKVDDNYSKAYAVNELRKRKFDRLMSGFVKKSSQYDNEDNLFEVLKDTNHNQRQGMPTTDSEKYYLL